MLFREGQLFQTVTKSNREFPSKSVNASMVDNLLFFNGTNKNEDVASLLEKELKLTVTRISSFEEIARSNAEKKLPGNILAVIIIGVLDEIQGNLFKENFEVVRFFRHKARFRHLPILYLAKNSDYKTKLACISAGAEFIGVPIRKKELILLVKKYIGYTKEILDLKMQLSQASEIQNLYWEESKNRQIILQQEIENAKTEIEKQSMAQDAMFELSRQELLEANSKIKKQYEQEIKTLKEKNKIEAIFGKYVSPEIVSRVTDPEKSRELDGIRREIAVFFADIRGFTSFSEKLNPDKVIFILNEFFTEMTEIIHEIGGWVDKYSGDNIMALFGAPLEIPNYSEKAVTAAYEVQKTFRKLKEEWFHIFHIDAGLRIGIATGQTVIGNIGSFQKVSYTAIGDIVNVASRLETSCPDGNVLMNEACYKQLSDSFKEKYKVSDYKKIELKGKSEPVLTYSMQL